MLTLSERTNGYGLITPKGWWETTLGEVCSKGYGTIQTGPFGSQLHAHDYTALGTPVVMPQQLGDNCISTEGIARISPEDCERLKRHRLEVGDIVFSRRGDVTRRSFITPRENGWLCGTGCMLIRANHPLVCNEFLAFFFSLSHVKEYITKQAVGATMPNLNTGILKAIPLFLPSLCSQQKIVTVLKLYDDLIENNTRRIAILEAMAQAIYREWFVEFRFPGHENIKLVDSPLGMMPEGWRIATLKSITTKIGSGATPRGGKESYQTNGISLIRSLNIYDNQFELKDLAFIDNNQAEQLDNVTIHKRDILLNITGASVARCCMVPSYLIPARVNQHVAIIRVDPIMADPFYVLNTINSERHKRQILALAQGGATREALTKDTISNYEILLPPRNILRQYADIISNVFDQRELLEKKNNCLRKTRDLLLPKLISGELEVEDLDILVAVDETQQSDAINCQTSIEVKKNAPVKAPSPVGTPFKDDAAVICVLLDELIKGSRPTKEFFIQKHIFALKHRLGMPVNCQFSAMPAGPWSKDLRHKAIFTGQEGGWFQFNEVDKTVSVGQKFEAGLEHARRILGERYAEVRAMVQDLLKFGNHGLERWMTVFKVVLDLKDVSKRVTRESIQQGIDNWKGKRDKEHFSVAEVDKSIHGMVKQGWIKLDS